MLRASEYLSDIPPHPSLSVLNLNFPLTREQILNQFREQVQSLPPGKNRIAIIDAIISSPGVWMPWKEMVNICKEQGVLSVVDAAHAIGQEVGIDLSESKPDFWISVNFL